MRLKRGSSSITWCSDKGTEPGGKCAFTCSSALVPGHYCFSSIKQQKSPENWFMQEVEAPRFAVAAVALEDAVFSK